MGRDIEQPTTLFERADTRVAKLREIARREESRNSHWRIEAVLREDADLIEHLANELDEARDLLCDAAEALWDFDKQAVDALTNGHEIRSWKERFYALRLKIDTTKGARV